MRASEPLDTPASLPSEPQSQQDPNFSAYNDHSAITSTVIQHSSHSRPVVQLKTIPAPSVVAEKPISSTNIKEQSVVSTPQQSQKPKHGQQHLCVRSSKDPRDTQENVDTHTTQSVTDYYKEQQQHSSPSTVNISAQHVPTTTLSSFSSSKQPSSQAQLDIPSSLEQLPPLSLRHLSLTDLSDEVVEAITPTYAQLSSSDNLFTHDASVGIAVVFQVIQSNFCILFRGICCN